MLNNHNSHHLFLFLMLMRGSCVSSLIMITEIFLSHFIVSLLIHEYKDEMENYIYIYTQLYKNYVKRVSNFSLCSKLIDVLRIYFILCWLLKTSLLIVSFLFCCLIVFSWEFFSKTHEAGLIHSGLHI